MLPKKRDIKTRGYILCQIRVKVRVLQPRTLVRTVVRAVVKKTKKTKDLKSKEIPELKEFRNFYAL
ncbi:MAG: hypothetical protein ACI8WT_001522 [Clostridium sp.]|jgi:hypothetical protein